MAGKITTLFINDTSIRVLVTSGKRIVKLAEVPLDMELDETSVKVKEAELAAKIKLLFSANKINTNKVILGLSGLHCLSRPVVLPNLPWAMVDEAMLREADRVLPVPAEQLHISWQILAATGDTMQAFMLAVPRQIADPLLGIMNRVGIKPYLMDIKPLALARLVPEPDAIMVDVQPKDFDVVILSRGIPQPIRSVPLPQESISVADRLTIIKDEVQRTVQFHNSNNPENPIEPGVTLYVSGEISEDTDYFEQLENELGYRVVPLLSPLKSSKHLDPSNYLINVGLALKEIDKEAGPMAININILPAPYLPKQISIRKLMALPAMGIAAIIIAMLAMTIQNAAANISSTQSQLESTNRIIEQRQAQNKELTDSITSLENKIASNQALRGKFTKVYDNLVESCEVFNGDLRAVVDNLVSNVNLTAITQNKGSGLIIAGTATNEQEILSYARKLDATGRFEYVIITSAKRDSSEEGDDGLFDFTITLPVDKEK